MLRIEAESRLDRIAVIREVIVLLRHIRQEDLKALRQRHFVIAVFLDRRAQLGQNLRCPLFIRRIRRTQIRHEHMRAHVHVVVGHVARHRVIRRARFRTGVLLLRPAAHIHPGHAALLAILLALLLRSRCRCNQ